MEEMALMEETGLMEETITNKKKENGKCALT